MENKQGLLYLTPKASYYNTKQEVVKEANRLHEAVLTEDRALYTYLLYFSNSTYFSKGLIVEKLLANSLHKEEQAAFFKADAEMLAIEDALIQHALFGENITHALKLLLSLKAKRINNSRTRRVILSFLFKRGNLDRIAIKYKQKVKELLIHALGAGVVHGIAEREEKSMKKFYQLVDVYQNRFALETFDFVFGKEQKYASPLYSEYMKVRKDFETGNVALDHQTELPIEVLEGFNSFYKRHLYLDTLLQKAVVSDKQKIQMQNRVAKVSTPQAPVKLEVDFSKFGIAELVKYRYSRNDISEEEAAEIDDHIKRLSLQLKDAVKDEFIVDLEKTAFLLDVSDSHKGSAETKNHPFYKNLTLALILTASYEQGDQGVYYAGGKWDADGTLQPEGHTDLTKGLLSAAKDGYTNLIVFSDGFENVGSFDLVHSRLAEIGHNINVVHFNPVFSPKNFAFKMLSERVLSVPYTDEKDLGNLALFCLLGTDKEAFKQVMRERITSDLLQ